MTHARLVLAATLLVLAACPQPQQTRGDAIAAPTAASSGPPAAPRPVAAPATPAAPAASPAAPTIVNVLPGVFEIANDSDAVQRLAVQASIERQHSSDAWTEEIGLDLGKGYRLVESCVAPPPVCVELVPHTALRPVRFTGFSCSAQCNGTCRGNAWLGPATFRLTVKTCGSGTSVSGGAFELPDAMSAPAFERWSLVSDVALGRAMRLDPPAPGWKGDEPASPGKVAGLAVRQKTARALDPDAMKALVRLMRDPQGFDDDIVKRCKMKDLVGFEVTRSLAAVPSGPARNDIVEIAIDGTCHKLFAVRGGGAGSRRTLHATHYDPSRAGFAALIKLAGI